MKTFRSEAIISSRPVEMLFGRVSSFDGIQELMPEQIINWTVNGDECSFTIRNMADISLKYRERAENSFVKIVSVKAPFDLVLTISFEPAGPEQVACRTTLEAHLNPMLAMLASRPLQHLVDTISRNLAG
jgi:hypothetical protein